MSTTAVKANFQLAKAWQLKGHTAAAIAGFERVLQLDPHYQPAYLELGGLLLRQGQAQAALRCYEQALALDPADPLARFRHSHVQQVIAAAQSPHQTQAVPLADNPLGKIDLRDQVSFSAHRSGWNYALGALMPLHNSGGVLFDGFIERHFAWNSALAAPRPPAVLAQMRREGTFDALATAEEKGIVPYKRPWVGFLHNPQAMPSWLHYQEAPQTIFAKPIWQQSLQSCLGLFTLSEYHAAWLRQQTGKPVSALLHPTEIPALQFSFSRFMANRQKKIVQVGWWLRRLNAIYQLPIPADNALGYEKIRLAPRFFANADHYLRQLIAREALLDAVEVDPAFATNTGELQHLAATDYDALLAENIVFVELYDANANNAVIECIARATPLLINPLPAVVEYLGRDYPFYFTSLPEAAAKALDPALINATHQYLATCETRPKLSADYFRRSFAASEVYRLI